MFEHVPKLGRDPKAATYWAGTSPVTGDRKIPAISIDSLRGILPFLQYVTTSSFNLGGHKDGNIPSLCSLFDPYGVTGVMNCEHRIHGFLPRLSNHPSAQPLFHPTSVAG